MSSGRTTALRAATILALAVVAIGAFALVSPSATSSLTKKKALKLFYTKKKADARFVEEAEAFTGAFSCAGNSWQTGESGDEFNANGGMRQPTASGSFAGVVFICNVALPQGATITAVRFTVRDPSATDQIESMSLGRHRLTPSIGTTDTLAFIPGTGDPQTPGDVQLSSTAISNPIVDNTTYAYSLVCIMDPTAALGLWGAVVEYTVTGAQGAAS